MRRRMLILVTLLVLIITRELTDRLDLTDAVFGQYSSWRALLVSPDHQHVLYFVAEPLIEACAHACVRSQVFIARADGSDSRRLGSKLVLAYNLAAVHWGANEHVYLTFGPEDGMTGSYYTVDLCLDGSCDGLLSETLAALGVPYAEETIVFPSVSDDGQFLAFERFRNYGDPSGAGAGMGIVGLSDSAWVELPDNGDVPLPGLWLPSDLPVERYRNELWFLIDVDAVVDRESDSLYAEGDVIGKTDADHIDFEAGTVEVWSGTWSDFEFYFPVYGQHDWALVGLYAYFTDGWRLTFIGGGLG